MQSNRAHIVEEEIPPDYYEVMGAARDADDDAIYDAYIKKSWELYPRGNSGDSEKFVEMKAAYDVLRNPLLRAKYDRENPPREKSGKTSTTNTGNASEDSQSDGKQESGDQNGGNGSAELNSGTNGSAGASGIQTEPRPQPETKKSREQREQEEEFGASYVFIIRPLTRPPPYGTKYDRLRRENPAPQFGNMEPSRNIQPRPRYRLEELALAA